MPPVGAPRSRRGWLILLAVVAIVGGLWTWAAVSTHVEDVASSRAQLKEYGVLQTSGEQWRPFYLTQLESARDYMRAHPVSVPSGWVEAAIVRSEDWNSGDCDSYGDCWEGLMVYRGDRMPGDYHIITTYGTSTLPIINACYSRGSYVLLNLRAMQRNSPSNNIDSLAVIAPAYPNQSRCVIRSRSG